jgi:hypothetical protein
MTPIIGCVALIRAFVDEEHGDCATGIDYLAKLSRQLGELLEEHDATDDDYRAVVALVLDPFMRARDLSGQVKQEIFRACEDGFGVTITRTH